MAAKCNIKAQVLCPAKGIHREVTVLNRALRGTEAGIEYEPDQRHADLVIKGLGLEYSRFVSLSVVAESREEHSNAEGTEPVDAQSASRFRSIAARLHYLSLDRPDRQSAAQDVAKHMAKLRQKSGRYSRE